MIARHSSEDGSGPYVGWVLENRYELIRRIGRGGMGVVYLAADRKTQCEVVVKFLSQSLLEDPKAVARFRREARQLANTRHDNIVALHSHGEQDEQIYLVMEYVRGVSLEAFLDSRGGRLTLQEFVPIAAQILKGIGHAHSREMALRDIKTPNIMLTQRKGRANFVKILDFGLAKKISDDVQITQEHVVGTVGYVPPEILSGEPGDLRVDVYALGVLFFVMLAGRMPFEGESASAVFYKTVTERAPRLDAFLPEDHALPSGLVDLVAACLEKEPNARPDDANSIVEQLIDSVSASLFRLPKADPVAHVLPGQGNTAMYNLLGKGRGSAEPIAEPLTERSSLRRRVAGTGLALALAGGVALAVISRDADVPDASIPPVRIASMIPPAEVAAADPGAAESRASADAGSHEPMSLPLYIVANPTAQVSIDGAVMGRTPYEAQLARGYHTVRLARDGYRPWQSNVAVNDRSRRSLLVDLEAPERHNSRPSERRSLARRTPEPAPPPPEPESSDVPEPASDVPEPASDVPEPASNAPEPASDVPEPASDVPEPEVEDPKPSDELGPPHSEGATMLPDDPPPAAPAPSDGLMAADPDRRNRAREDALLMPR